MPVWIHKVFGFIKFCMAFNKEKEGGHVLMPWFVAKNRGWRKRYIATTLSRKGEDEFRFLEEDQAHHLELKDL